MKIRIVGAELLHADEQAGRQACRQAGRHAGRQAGRQAGMQAGVTKLIVTFRGFANVLCISLLYASWFLIKIVSFGLLFFFSMG